jgi:hypothetical protein
MILVGLGIEREQIPLFATGYPKLNTVLLQRLLEFQQPLPEESDTVRGVIRPMGPAVSLLLWGVCFAEDFARYVGPGRRIVRPKAIFGSADC